MGQEDNPDLTLVRPAMVPNQELVDSRESVAFNLDTVLSLDCLALAVVSLDTVLSLE